MTYKATHITCALHKAWPVHQAVLAFTLRPLELPSVFRLPLGGFHATRFFSC